MVENFDKWLTIHQSFPYKPLSLNVSPMKTTINDSLVKVLPVKHLCFTVIEACLFYIITYLH